MEIDEVAARVVRSYWALLLVMTVVPLTLVALLMSAQVPPSVAKSRLQAGGGVTDAEVGDAGVSIVVSKVKAFATSDTLLRDVLRQQGIDRSPTKVAKAVEVSGLGTSTIVELSVKDSEPDVAQALTDAIGTAVVQEINESSQGAIRQRLAEIDERVRVLQRRLGPLTRGTAERDPDTDTVNERDLVQAELADLRSDRSDLRNQLLATSRSSVVQPAVLAPTSDPTVMMSVIAGLVGLVGGILIAVVVEAARPTIPGQRRVARRLGVPLLGHTDRGPGQLADLGRRVRLAAKKQDVDRVTLVGAPGPLPHELVSTVAAAVYGDGVPYGDDASTVAARPVHARVDDTETSEERPAGSGGKDADGDDPSPSGPGSNNTGSNTTGSNTTGTEGAKSTSLVRAAGTAVMPKTPVEVAPVEARRPVAARPLCHVHAFEDMDPNADDVVGVVVAVGPVTTAAGLDAVRDLVAASGWPLLGVVAASRKETSPQNRGFARIRSLARGRTGT
ncbi:capsular polysaccharide biosynthesis protein [Actinomadura pelletieri DSM 43383]|uniref:Capsular polysaccharide biosynthesis protein n=1 Tax=Actinomadura pelletieri DSM 43383 TaxID=1120940 RepID=A0A495QSV8_9ACTN|nr:hypothetical protein [Actinomadura pelletieri]RKS76589.1 capsular polysaccharide biosynthesis protein [Actinomadura pelletieri DSM 43383]